MTMENIVEGVFAVNKPSGISSAQVIRDLQKHFNPSRLFAPWIESERKSRLKEPPNQRNRRREKVIQVKVGHGGTLDPLATGVLITGVGRGTKSLQDFLKCTKVYETVVLFGTSTDTYDRVGKVLKRAPFEHVTKEMVEKALEQFRGKFMQLPPLFSALKMNGKPLYEYARAGKQIPREIERRPTEVLELEMIEWMEGGTHPYVAPTDQAGYAEVNVANQLWKQENVLPGNKQEDKTTDTKDESEKKVNKLNTLSTTKARDITTSQPLGVIDAHFPARNDEIKNECVEKGKDNSSSTVAETSLNQENSGRETFEFQKRKLSESHDDLVINRPPTKKPHKGSPVSSVDNAMMSGGLISSSTESENALDETNETKLPPAVRLRMTVASGFYVRSLCHDLGVAVGSAALMAELERTRQGDYKVGENVLEYADLEQGEQVWGPKVEKWLDDWRKRNPTLLGSQGKLMQKQGRMENSNGGRDHEAKGASDIVTGECSSDATKPENLMSTSLPQSATKTQEAGPTEKPEVNNPI